MVKIEKLEIGPTGAAASPANMEAVATKLNEVVDAMNTSLNAVLRGVQPPRQEPTNAQHIAYMLAMVQRLRSGPLATLDPKNDESKAIEDALSAFQVAVEEYKASLPEDVADVSKT